MRYSLTVGALFALVLAAPATAEFTIYDDFDDTELDTSKWTLNADPGEYQITDSEFQFNVSSAGSLYMKDDALEFPDAVGEKLTVEWAWRHWANPWFTQPSVAMNAFDLVSGAVDPDSRIWNGAVMTNTTNYRVKNADNASWQVSDFVCPTVQTGNGEDFDFDYFRLMYEVVDDGQGGAQYNYLLTARGHEGDTVEPEWRTLLSQEGYASHKPVGGLRFGAGNHNLGIDYVKYEFTGAQTIGDASGDGMVEDDDLSLLLSSWGQDVGWANGNFNGDNIVDDDDLSLLLANWTGGAAVPEPATAALLGLGALAMLRRRSG